MVKSTISDIIVRKKYKPRRNRRYISAKKKAKLTKFGNKRKYKYHFLSVFATTMALSPQMYNVSSIESSSLNIYVYNKYKFGSDVFQIEIDNYDCRTQIIQISFSRK